jgi:hypothetical protein
MKPGWAGERLDKILIAYGGITKKSFIEKIRRFRVEQTPLDDLNELIPRLRICTKTPSVYLSS